MTSTQKNKILNIFLWIAQFVLAAFFFMAGFTKATTHVDQLHEMINWTNDVPLWLVRFIGVSEILGSTGLLVPSILRIKPILTPIAACALIVVMVLAIFFHISRGEANVIGMHFTVIALASFIAWGRFKRNPVLSKQISFDKTIPGSTAKA